MGLQITPRGRGNVNKVKNRKDVVELTLIDTDNTGRHTHIHTQRDACIYATALKVCAQCLVHTHTHGYTHARTEGIPVRDAAAITQCNPWIKCLRWIRSSIKMWLHLDWVNNHHEDTCNSVPSMWSPQSPPVLTDFRYSEDELSVLLTFVSFPSVWSVMQWRQGDDSGEGVVPGQCQHMRPKSAEAPRLPKPPATTSNTPRIETSWNVIHMVLISSLAPFLSEFFRPVWRTWIGRLVVWLAELLIQRLVEWHGPLVAGWS